MVDIRANDRTDAGDELEKFGEVDVVAVLLLKAPPIEPVDVVRKFLADSLPVFHDGEDFAPATLAGERQLKDVQDVNPFAIIFRINPVAGGNLEEHLHLQAEPKGEVGQTEQHATKSGHSTFGGSRVSIEGNAAPNVFLQFLQRIKGSRLARCITCTKEYSACHLLDGNSNHLVNLLGDEAIYGHLYVLRHVVDHRWAFFHLPLPRLQFPPYLLFVFQGVDVLLSEPICRMRLSGPERIDDIVMQQLLHFTISNATFL